MNGPVAYAGVPEGVRTAAAAITAAASAAELLLRKLANDERVRNLRVRPELIVRSTTCPAPVASLRGVPRRKVSSSR